VSAREISDAVLQLKGLVHVRAILEERGATEAELDEHTAEIDRVRDRLAALTREAEGLLTAA
jgi:hypothetical protein